VPTPPVSFRRDFPHKTCKKLVPEENINVQAKPVHRDFHAFGDRVDPSNPVEHDVDRADKDLPGAIEREKVSEKIKIFSLTSFGPFDSLSHVLHVVDLHEELAAQFLQSKYVLRNHTKLIINKTVIIGGKFQCENLKSNN